MSNTSENLLIHPGSIPGEMAKHVAEGLGARLVDSHESGGRMIVFLDARLVAAPWLRALDRGVLCVPPELPPAALDPLSRRSGKGSPARLVLHTPMHHLYAVERLGYDASELELIPWSVDVPTDAASSGARDESMLVEVQFPGSEVNFAGRMGLGREARIETVDFADKARSLQLLGKAGVVLIAPADRESGAGTDALLWAMAVGAPIVAAKTWGFEHLLIPGVEGLFFEVGNSASGREEIRRLLSDPESARQYGQVAAAKFNTALSLDYYIARLRRIILNSRAGKSPEFFLIAAHGRAEGSVPS